jgi:serine/threonine protein phosphatase PrpC
MDPDNATEYRERSESHSSVEVASVVMANPDHPEHAEDRAIAIKLAGGKSGLIAAIDGVGSGGENSSIAADITQKHVRNLETKIISPPTINQGLNLLSEQILLASDDVRKLQKEKRDNQIDATISTSLICESKDGNKLFLLIGNVGDSRGYIFSPHEGKVEQLTKDHSLVQMLVDSGEVSEDKAFLHPQRNIVLRTVGSVKGKVDIDFTVREVKKGDVYLAVSDGFSDNLTPEGLQVAIPSEFRESYDDSNKSVDMNRFVKGLAQRANNVMTDTNAPQRKPDDITVTAMRIPRAS